jgi:hypothetical protein
MAKKRQPRIVHTREAVAQHYSVSTSAVHKWFVAGCPHRTRGRGKEGTYNLDDIDAWRRSRQGADEGDPLLVGPATPALERYRGIQADLAQLKLERERGMWLPKELVMQGLAILASKMRMAFDMLQRQFGPEALAVVNDALGEAEQTFMRGIGNDADNGLNGGGNGDNVANLPDESGVSPDLSDDAAPEGTDAS